MIHAVLREPGRVCSPLAVTATKAAIQVAGSYAGVTARLEVSLDGEHWAMSCGTGLALNSTSETDVLWQVDLPPQGRVAFHLLNIARGEVQVWITTNGG